MHAYEHTHTSVVGRWCVLLLLLLFIQNVFLNLFAVKWYIVDDRRHHSRRRRFRRRRRRCHYILQLLLCYAVEK